MIFASLVLAQREIYNVFKHIKKAFPLPYRVYIWAIIFAFPYLGVVKSTGMNAELSYFIVTYIICGTFTCIYGRNEYEPGNSLYGWYENNYQYMGNRWTEKLYDVLKDNKLINLVDESFVFCSPTANRGTYEKELFELVNNDRNNNKYIVCDLAVLPNVETDLSVGSNVYSYHKGIDANYIDCFLDKLGYSNVNILYDYKGCIWHKLDKKKHKKLIDIFRVYHSVLKPGGTLIIDNNHSKNMLINNLVWTLFTKIIGFCEDSTGHQMRSVLASRYGNKKNLADFIKNKFDILYLGEPSAKTGIVAFVKK